MSCNREEVDLSNIDAIRTEYGKEVFKKTIIKHGPPKYEEGVLGGTYYTYVASDPKSFNTLNARDGYTAQTTDHFYPNLFTYDAYKKEFAPDFASFEIEYDEVVRETYVTINLRDDIFWTTANGKKIKISTDDVIFWYNEVEGDKAVQHPGYPGQFMTTRDGEKKQIVLEKIDARKAKFILPVVSANPLLYVNMSFGPFYIYEPAKQANGVNGLYDVLSIDTDPKNVPSAGLYLLSEYQPGQYLVFTKNPDFWKKDTYNKKLPYIEKKRMNIITSEDVALLSFKQGDLSSYGARPEDLDSLLESSETPKSYDVYNKGASLGSVFITFNQNIGKIDEHKTTWFSNKYFRQAMSSLLPRDRIVDEVYRGLAEPAYYFFAKINSFFDENIILEYQFNPENAKKLLKKAGITPNVEKRMVDENNVHIEFDIFLGTENSISQDIVSLFADELEKVGITLNVKPIDFQNLVERVTKSYNWDSIIVSLGSNYFPSSGSNVWQSSGNFHVWNPLQESPATQWEARIDELYQIGLYTIDKEQRKKVYDEYQQIILEQLPLMYIVYPTSFVAYDKKIKNLYVDALEGSKFEFLFIQE